uniref:Uncharacterized protein n=1 Tax=Oryza punctata TaxID=4537 RepID=A0A0E0MA06_ORYPU
MVIARYLDEAFPGAGAALLPSNPPRPRRRSLLGLLHRRQGSYDHRALVRLNINSLTQFIFSLTILVLIDRCVYYYVYIDVALGGFIHECTRWRCCSFDAAKTPLLAVWLERVGELEAYKAVMPDAGMMIEFKKKQALAPPPPPPPQKLETR